MTNSDNESEGRALIQAWKNASALVSVAYLSAMRDEAPLESRGRITAFDESRIVVCVNDSDELEVDLAGAVFSEVGSTAKFLSLGLDPSGYAEMVEISLGNMDILTLSALRGDS